MREQLVRRSRRRAGRGSSRELRSSRRRAPAGGVLVDEAELGGRDDMTEQGLGHDWGLSDEVLSRRPGGAIGASVVPRSGQVTQITRRRLLPVSRACVRQRVNPERPLTGVPDVALVAPPHAPGRRRRPRASGCVRRGHRQRPQPDRRSRVRRRPEPVESAPSTDAAGSVDSPTSRRRQRDARAAQRRAARGRAGTRAAVARAVHERLPADRRAAPGAGLVLAAVDGERAREVPALPVDVDVQRVEGRPARGERLAQHVADAARAGRRPPARVSSSVGRAPCSRARQSASSA